jgi:dihydrofolate reductase
MHHLVLISAVASNGVIGTQNTLPWRLPEDLAFFKKVTLGHAIVMGRTTYESIGRPLPGRCNIVVTRNTTWRPAELADSIPCVEAKDFQFQPDVKTSLVICNSIEQALSVAKKINGSQTEGKDIFVIGGSQIYEALLPHADALILTQIHHEFVGDAYFPHWSKSDFKEVWRENHGASEERPWSYSFVRYERQTNTQNQSQELVNE